MMLVKESGALMSPSKGMMEMYVVLCFIWEVKIGLNLYVEKTVSFFFSSLKT